MYRKKMWQAGNTIEVHKTYYTNRGRRRGKKQNPTSEAVAKYNEKMAFWKLTRLLNENFNPKDLFLSPTYKVRVTPEESKKYFSKFLRDLRAYFRERNQELKYVAVTAYGKHGAIHHHIVINSADAREIMDLWPHGGVRFTPLYKYREYSALAWYLIKQSRKKLNGETCSSKRWSSSRNLRKPKEKIEEVSAKTWREEPQPLKGYYIDKSSIESGVSPVSGQPYLLYRMIAIKPNERSNQ